jgi:hypothetical protein
LRLAAQGACTARQFRIRAGFFRKKMTHRLNQPGGAAAVEAQTKLRPALRCTTQARMLIGISLTNVTQLQQTLLTERSR